MKWLQLSNEETSIRLQRYLRLPLAVIAPLTGKRAIDTHGTVVDCHGDALLSGYHAIGDAEHTHWHNALRDACAGAASQAKVVCEREKGKVKGTKKTPGDLRCPGSSGAHGWTPAHQRELWADITVVCPVLQSYVKGASQSRGFAAAAAARNKLSKYSGVIPGLAFFLPLAFETEGYQPDALEKLFLGWAHKRADAVGLVGQEAKRQAARWVDYWLNDVAMTNARFMARCVFHRAQANISAKTPASIRSQVQYADMSAASRRPPPPPQPPEIAPAAPGIALARS